MNSNIHKLNYLVFENNPPVSTSLGLVQKKTIYTSAFVVPHIITLIIWHQVWSNVGMLGNFMPENGIKYLTVKTVKLN